MNRLKDYNIWFNHSLIYIIRKYQNILLFGGDCGSIYYLLNDKLVWILNNKSGIINISKYMDILIVLFYDGSIYFYMNFKKIKLKSIIFNIFCFKGIICISILKLHYCCYIIWNSIFHSIIIFYSEILQCLNKSPLHISCFCSLTCSINNSL